MSFFLWWGQMLWLGAGTTAQYSTTAVIDVSKKISVMYPIDSR